MKNKWKRIGISVATVLCLYVFSFIFAMGWPVYEHVGAEGNSTVYVFTGNLRMSVHSFTQDPQSASYEPELVRMEKAAFSFYYPLVKIGRLFRFYHLYDEDIPSMGG